MSTVAQYLPESSQQIFARLFDVDPETISLDDVVLTRGLEGDLGKAIGSDKPLDFYNEFRKILQPANFARENDGFLSRQAAELARRLVILDAGRYKAQATAFVQQGHISVQEAMVIVEALRRYADKKHFILPSPVKSGAVVNLPIPQVEIAHPIASPNQDILLIDQRKRLAFETMAAAVGNSIATEIVFEEPDALHEEFFVPETARAALARLGFEEVGQISNGLLLRQYKHIQSGLRLNMLQRANAEPLFALGFGLLEGTFVPGTYEDMKAEAVHTARISLGDFKSQKRRIVFYYLNKITADDLPRHLQELQALVSSNMMALTRYIKDPAVVRLVGDGIHLENYSLTNRVEVQASTPTVAKLLALNNIVLDYVIPRPSTAIKAEAPISASKAVVTAKPDLRDDTNILTGGAIPCYLVGMQGSYLIPLMQHLRGENIPSEIAHMMKTAAREVQSSLGPLPTFDTQLLRMTNLAVGDDVNYGAVIPLLSSNSRNLVCMGVSKASLTEALEFIGEMRSKGDKTLIAAIYDKNIDPHEIAALCRAGADRAISNGEKPEVILSMLVSFVRNDEARVSGMKGIETFGPLCIEWDFLGNRSSRNIIRVSIQNGEQKKPFRLTGKEALILERLVRRPGEIATKDDLMNYLYNGRDEPELKIIDVFVCKLRKKIHDTMSEMGCDVSGLQQWPISTVWGKGYVFNPNFGKDVEMVAKRPAAVAEGTLLTATT